jgi:hypothetical protein
MSQQDGSDEPRTDRPTSGRSQRTGEEASYTSESFEVNVEAGTDSPLSTSPPGDDGSGQEQQHGRSASRPETG